MCSICRGQWERAKTSRKLCTLHYCKMCTLPVQLRWIQCAQANKNSIQWCNACIFENAKFCTINAQFFFSRGRFDRYTWQSLKFFFRSLHDDYFFELHVEIALCSFYWCKKFPQQTRFASVPRCNQSFINSLIFRFVWHSQFWVIFYRNLHDFLRSLLSYQIVSDVLFHLFCALLRRYI